MRILSLYLAFGVVVLFSSAITTKAQTVPIIVTQPWTDTGIFLNQGQVAGITASGTMDYWGGPGGCSQPWPGYPGCIVTPAGIPWPGPCNGTIAPGLACVGLIGMIGSGAPFDVGIGRAVTAQSSGELFLGVSDGFFADNTGSWTASISVGQGQQLQINSSTLPIAQVGNSYDSGALSASGGIGPYHWSIANAPPGIDISYYTGDVYGLPANAGSFFPTVVVTDSTGATASKAFTLAILAAPTKTRFTPQQKAQFALWAELNLKSAAIYQILLEECKQATAGEPHSDPLGANCNFQAVSMLSYGLLGLTFNALAADPADPNYKTVAPPVTPALPIPIQSATFTATQLAIYQAWKNVVMAQAQLIGLARAVFTAVNRAEGAFEAGSSTYEQLQVAAITRYEQQMAFAVQVFSTDAAEFERLWGNSGFDPFTITSSDAMTFSTTITQSGLPADVQQQLATFGASPDDLTFLQTSWSSFDPNTLSGDITHSANALIAASKGVTGSIVIGFASSTADLRISRTAFELVVPFTLGTNSNGIQPHTEDVSFSIGSLSITIPAGRFIGLAGGKLFIFLGQSGGLPLLATISSLPNKSYMFDVFGVANLSKMTNPTQVGLLIGNDGATQTANVKIY